MLKLPEHEQSLWLDKQSRPAYPEMSEDQEVDVAVIGGGISGLSAAYRLKQAGKTVAVVEKDCVGAGTSGHTTGKVTSQHGLIYKELSQHFGTEAARLYGQANEAAIQEMEDIIKKERISCGWQRRDNYIFTRDRGQVKKYKEEAAAAKAQGLPASFTSDSPLPFDTAGAVKFTEQAHFHIGKYLTGLAAAVNGNGSYIYEHSRATGFIESSPCLIALNNHTLCARDVIIATNVPTFPLAARGTYCIREYPQRSYIVAGKSPARLSGMHISYDKDEYSILGVENELVLVGGRSHLPGTRGKSKQYQALAEYGRERFGFEEIKYMWNARDYIAYDNLPLAGKLYRRSKHFYVVSAFAKWGLTNSLVAAEILRDAILGQPNKYAALYNPARPSLIKSIPRAAPSYISRP